MALCLLAIFQPAFSQKRIKVVLLATYHMGGTTDALKVDNEKDNILGADRQKQLGLLLDVLEASKAEKIYVESEPGKQAFWDSIYHDHYIGKPVAMKNEIFQIGIKLAKRLNIRRGVTCVDWGQYDNRNRSERYFSEYAMKMNMLSDSLKIDEEDEFTAYDKMVFTELEALNTMIPAMDLVLIYRTLNSDTYLRKFFYANVTTYLDKNEQGMGAFWSQFNMMRNVNIYSNIMKDLLEERPENVLVLYGAGHIQALKSMFEAHPAIEVVMFDDLFKK